MNEKRITFQVDKRKFTIKLVLDTKPQNKVHYYTMSKSEDIIDLTLTEDDIMEAMKENDEGHSIIVESEEESDILMDENTTLIPSKLKGKFLDEAIASYKSKCRQYIEQKKAE